VSRDEAERVLRYLDLLHHLPETVGVTVGGYGGQERLIDVLEKFGHLILVDEYRAVISRYQTSQGV